MWADTAGAACRPLAGAPSATTWWRRYSPDSPDAPARRAAAAAGEQAEPVIKPGGEPRHGQRVQPGRGELDGQQDAVQAAADVADGLPR
jgi:hypothetical protein